MKPMTFNLRVSDAELLKRSENQLKYINLPVGRTTQFQYGDVENGLQVPYISYKCFESYEEVVHGFSTRLGGVSKEHLSSMNLSFSRGDDPSNVMENHRRLGKAIGYDHTRLVFSDQVHDTVIKVITEEDCGRGISEKEKYEGVDGLVTNCTNVPLITFYADCVPLYIYDPVRHAIGLAHSGWRGTVAKIGSKIIDIMTKEYGSDPADLICAIGPSICMDCYEVSFDVIEEIQKSFSEEECKHLYYKKENDKYQLDLHQACYYNFIGSGVLEEHISKPDMCTCCNDQILYSHRASKGMRGNLGAVMMLKKL